MIQYSIQYVSVVLAITVNWFYNDVYNLYHVLLILIKYDYLRILIRILFSIH